MAQFVSSLGDWIGVVAIAAFAQKHFGTTAVGAILTARVLPSFVAGPLAGVLADRWDRRKTMVAADLIRAAIIFSLPFVPNLLYFLITSAILECLTLVWGPAKDASLPHFVPTAHLTHANSLSLFAVYGPWPLSTVVFASLATLGTFLGEHVPVLRGLYDSPEALALAVDSVTFAFSAVMISTLAIPRSPRRTGRFDLGAAWRDLVEGIVFVRDHKQVRPWMLGIAFTFTAAGGVFSLGTLFVLQVLNAGVRGFAFLVGFLGVGMIVGLFAAGFLAHRVKRDVLFSSSLFLLGISLIGLASTSSLDQAIPIASALGLFGGVGYSTGYSLIQETTEDEMRGRTFSAAYTLIRIGTLIGLGLFPLIAAAIGDHRVTLPTGDLALPGSRVTFWLAGLLVIGGGVLSIRAIRARTVTIPEPAAGNGYFIVFEGGEGAGKSTQIAALVDWLGARGVPVQVTSEPGGTAIGRRIREILLDPRASEMDPRTEALLYAADRAQHAAEVIRPALEDGKVVVSDRFIDSSLAYQGIARGLGVDQIYEISTWATECVLPDLVFFLRLDAQTRLLRVSDERDRIEREDADFHERVEIAYMQLAKKYAERFVVLDAARPPSEIHQEIIATVERRASLHVEPTAVPTDLLPPGRPVAP